MVELAKRYLPYRAFPGKVIRFLEELLVTAESEASPPSVVDLERAYDAFSLATQIPAFLLREDRPLLADRVIATFRERMVGQAEAVRRVVETLCVVKARLQPEGKPLASFLFIGPTGVGKTELARTLTRFLFGDEERMVRFDMSEYADGLAAERLIAGTYDSAGLLTSKVREQPFCVLLLDEIEKAHPAVLDLLLQVLGEGRLSDARGQTTHFDNAIIILTSNLGASHQRAPLGFPDRRETAESQYDRAIHQAFRPELVNRLDRVITFHPLTEEEVAQVVTIALRRIGERRGIQQGGLGLELSEGALAQVAAEGYSDTYGVRALRRHLDRAVVDPVSELVASLGPEAQGAFVWVARPEEPDCPHHSAKHRLRSLIRSDLRFDVFRRDAATGKKALRGVWGVVALRREADRLMQLETVLRIDEQIGMLRSQIALAARAQRKSRKRRVVDQVDLERMRIELHRLSTAYDAAREKQLDLHAAEQLALAALYAGDDADSLYAEASALDDEFKRRLFYLLVAERPSRNAITLLLSEPGRPGLLRAWLDGLYRNAPHRHFRVIAHVRDREQMKRGWPSDPAWPAERAWSPPKDEAWMRPHVVDRPGNHRAVLLRIEGPAAALLLGLEAGLHRRVSQAKDETPSHLLIERIALETQLEDEDWLAEELNRGLPPDPSPKIPAFREHDPATVRLTIDGTVSLDVTFPSYFEQLEVIGLYHLLGALAAGMEEDIYRPSYRRKKPEEEAS